MATRLTLLATVPSGVPQEGPADHIRNALQLLIGHEVAHGSVWEYSPELRAAVARLFHALYALENGGALRRPV